MRFHKSLGHIVVMFLDILAKYICNSEQFNLYRICYTECLTNSERPVSSCVLVIGLQESQGLLQETLTFEMNIELLHLQGRTSNVVIANKCN